MNIIRISDGLGNQMFQYAFARKMQLESNEKIYLDTRFINNEDIRKRGELNNILQKSAQRKYGLSNFKVMIPIANRSVLWRWNYLEQNNRWERLLYELGQNNLWYWQYKDELDEILADISIEKQLQRSTYYRGYFFDLQYYDSIKDILQKEFKPKYPIKIPSVLKKVLQGDQTISIHIRKGDFTRLNRDISNMSYYPSAMEIMQQHLESPVYLIFSDDIEWVKQNMKIPANKIYVSEMGFKDYEELTIMKHCKHNIIANSTFSYWAAYLNSNSDKIVIAPQKWKTKIIPKEWIVI